MAFKIDKRFNVVTYLITHMYPLFNKDLLCQKDRLFIYYLYT